MMVHEITGLGAECGYGQIYGCAVPTVKFVPNIKLSIAAPTSLACDVIEATSKTTRKGKTGDGKTVAIHLAQAVRVCTGDFREDAL